jgi:hypothetical protein
MEPTIPTEFSLVTKPPPIEKNIACCQMVPSIFYWNNYYHLPLKKIYWTAKLSTEGSNRTQTISFFLQICWFMTILITKKKGLYDRLIVYINIDFMQSYNSMEPTIPTEFSLVTKPPPIEKNIACCQMVPSIFYWNKI